VNGSLELVTGPAVEPVTLDETKKFIRVEHADDDALIDRLIIVARQECERRTGFALITQTWNLHLDEMPDRSWLYIPKPPLQAVEEFSYLDPNGLPVVVPPEDYWVDTFSKPGRLEVGAWPSMSDWINTAVIRFVAGYGPAAEDVPEDKRQGMLLVVADLYEHRETVFPGHTLGELDTVRRLWSDRTFHF
jgi:uncharacterized phiE125 gp8 family phage protein